MYSEIPISCSYTLQIAQPAGTASKSNASKPAPGSWRSRSRGAGGRPAAQYWVTIASATASRPATTVRGSEWRPAVTVQPGPSRSASSAPRCSS